MSVTPEEVIQVQREADCLHEQAAVELALDAMAAAITHRLGEKNPLLLCVLTGAIIPMGHLLTRLDFPHEIDYVHASRYRGETSGGDESNDPVREIGDLWIGEDHDVTIDIELVCGVGWLVRDESVAVD